MRGFGMRDVLVSLLLLSECTSVDLSPPTYTSPSPPTQAALIAGVKTAATDAKLTPPFEISDVRPTDLGPGRYFVCMREVSPTSEKRFVYSVFYDNDVYKGARLSVIMEACESQPFAPISIDVTPSSSPSPKSRVTGRK
jgi:hypothetical protein